MISKNNLIAMLLVLLLITSGVSTVASAEEICVPTFHNIITGVNTVNINATQETSWRYINGDWYYFNELGKKTTGWINDNGNWYYCDSLGKMLHDTTIDNFKLGSNGAWIY